jgi:hypothetical protein
LPSPLLAPVTSTTFSWSPRFILFFLPNLQPGEGLWETLAPRTKMRAIDRLYRAVSREHPARRHLVRGLQALSAIEVLSSRIISRARSRPRIRVKIYRSARMFKIFVLEMLKNCCKSDFNVSFMHFFCGFLLFLIAVELA